MSEGSTQVAGRLRSFRAVGLLGFKFLGCLGLCRVFWELVGVQAGISLAKAAPFCKRNARMTGLATHLQHNARATGLRQASHMLRSKLARLEHSRGRGRGGGGAAVGNNLIRGRKRSATAASVPDRPVDVRRHIYLATISVRRTMAPNDKHPRSQAHRS